MTVELALELLTKIRDKHGNVEVFFDCPKCGIAYTPGLAITIALHLTETAGDK